jgi:hypothetical protein
MSPPREGPDRWAGPLAAVLACLSAVLFGVLDVLFVPLYVGASLVPIAAVGAVLGNIALPALAAVAAQRIGAGVVALLCWFLPVLVLTMYLRPEGDVLVLAQNDQEYNFYGLLLGGVVAGMATLAVLSRRNARRAAAQPGSVRYR